MTPISTRWLALAATFTFGACNLFTGLDDATFDGDNDGGNGSGAGGPAMALVDGVTITAIELNQGMRHPLVENGNPATSDIPLIAGRDAMLRVFYDGTAYNGQAVTARLTIGDGEPIVLQKLLNNGMSSQADLATTVNFDIPGEQLTGGGYRVELLQPATAASGSNAHAAYPAEGQAPLPVSNVGSQLKIVLVPVQYGADGSNRLPDTSDEQIELYRQTFYGMYPTPKVDIIVREPYPWNQQIHASGGGFETLLDAIIDYRASSGAAPDEYYYAIFTPTSDFGSFCGGGCVVGLSALAGPTDEWARAGVGIGYAGDMSSGTAAHEVGHQHGRGHAPCGTNNGLDPEFPHAGAGLGDWGYDLTNKELRAPNVYVDFMSYCDPTWISDHNFRKLEERIRLVNGAKIHYPEGSLDLRYEKVLISPDGTAHWSEPLRLPTPPLGNPTLMTATTEAGDVPLTGHFYRFSHIEGGMLLFPEQPAATKVEAEIQGAKISLQR